MSDADNNRRKTIMKKTFYYCVTDCYGQRTGYYKSIELTEAEAKEFTRQTGRFLYDDLLDVIRATQD